MTDEASISKIRVHGYSRLNSKVSVKLLNPKSQEQRKEERVLVEHTVKITNTQDVTRDISASGVYFWLDITVALGETINFIIEIGRKGVNFILKCVGEIVRVESRDGKIGVAVKISQSVMQSA